MIGVLTALAWIVFIAMLAGIPALCISLYLEHRTPDDGDWAPMSHVSLVPQCECHPAVYDWSREGVA